MPIATPERARHKWVKNSIINSSPTTFVSVESHRERRGRAFHGFAVKKPL